MKLRNKKTGEVYNACRILFGESLEGLEKTNWKTLKEFCEDWEDYKPAEPLIKDKKIRKAVRAWAEANDFVRVFYEYDYSNDVAVFMVGESKMNIESDELLDDNRNYTIAELCGEED